MKYIILFIIFISQTGVALAASVSGTADGVADEAKTGVSSILSNFFSTSALLSLTWAIVTLIITFFISKIVRFRLLNYLENKAGVDNDKEALYGVITRIVNLTIWSIGFLTALTFLGIDFTIFMGGIGIGLGFTLQVFLGNFISGVIMILQGSFSIGNIIEISDRRGKIVKVNSLFTVIEQFDGVRFFVPNIKFLQENVSNFHSNDKRRVAVDVQVDYNTDIAKAKAIINKIIESFPNILKAPSHMIIVDNLGDNGISLKVMFWISIGENYFAAKSNVTETINLAFRQSGITIPFPQITISNR